MRRVWERGIAVAFGVSILASIGLAVVYVRGGNPPLEGILLGLALGGIGLGLILWAHHALPAGSEEQLREQMRSPDVERSELAAEVDQAMEQTSRRKLLASMLGAAGVAFLGALAFPIRSLGPSPGRALFRTGWQEGRRLVDAEGEAITVDRLLVGGAITAYPEGEVGSGDSVLILIRVAPERIQLDPAREDWAPEGYLAYSKLCTHAACPVGLFDNTSGLLTCPCHQSAFQSLAGAVPVFGPAARPLPQLPLSIGPDGALVAIGDLTAPPGAGFWELPSG